MSRSLKRHLALSFVALWFVGTAVAQQTSQPTQQPQLSPQAAYEQATRPLEIVRDAMENWSDVEKNALGVAMLQAQAECKARDPKQYVGEDILAYLRLCTFAWNWNAVQAAAWLYINAQKKPDANPKVYTVAGLAQAYAYEIKSSLSLNDSGEAFICSQAMLQDVPYSDLSSQATGATARYLQMIHTNQARALLAQRYLLLLGLLRNQTTAPAESPRPPIPSLHLLYADAIQWPTLMQLVKDFGSDSLVDDLNKALPEKLSPDDAILIDRARRQYQMIGAPMPAVTATAYLAGPKFAVPESFGKDFGGATVFYLFPDWCAQCVRKGAEFEATAARVGKKNVRFYALLAQGGAPPKPPAPAKPAATGKGKGAPVVTVTQGPPTPAEQLTGTPTVIVPTATLQQFFADNFPWLIVTDGEGKIRFMEAAFDNSLEADSLVDQVVDRVLAQWPSAAKE